MNNDHGGSLNVCSFSSVGGLSLFGLELGTVHTRDSIQRSGRVRSQRSRYYIPVQYVWNIPTTLPIHSQEAIRYSVTNNLQTTPIKITKV